MTIDDGDFYARAGGPFASKTSDRSLHDVVRLIMERLGPDARFAKLLKECRKEVMADPELIDACVTAAVTNAITAIERIHRSKRSTGTEAARAATRDRVLAKAMEFGSGISETIATILDFPMPNGKQLRHCTFGEVAAFGERFAKIAKLGKPDQIVGDVITAKQAAKL
jgi:nitrogen fixation/metabolism regulation signal transduction histidine kinase